MWAVGMLLCALLVSAGCNRDNLGGCDGEACEPDDGNPNGASTNPNLPPSLATCASGIFCGSPAACCESGSECILGTCVTACPSSIRCGQDAETCCSDGEACINATCVSPGNPCTDSFDCAAGEFCDPVFNACFPQFAEVLCQTEPNFPDFEITEKWSVQGSDVEPNCFQPIVTPVVANLDGDPEGIPELVITTACNGWRRGVLRAYRPKTGEALWEGRLPNAEGGPGDIAYVHGRANPAVGDLTGDGLPEVVTVMDGSSGEGMRIAAFDGRTGVRLWVSAADVKVRGSNGNFNGAATLADLDGDGTPEIIYGALVLNADGTRRWENDDGAGEGAVRSYYGGIAVVADIDLDGSPDVVAGRRVYEANGDAKYPPLTSNNSNDGYPAVANLDSDPQAEIVLVHNGKVTVFDGETGAAQSNVFTIAGGGIGGPPTIADFNGNGRNEIGVAAAAFYTVIAYDPPGEGEDLGTLTELWKQPSRDLSSNSTGSSVFDFEGDGKAEVIYNDECHMRVFDGTTGDIVVEVPNTSATIHEYPIVVDVDGDGRSEIVFIANSNNSNNNCVRPLPDYPADEGVRTGIYVYGDANAEWVRTRRVWHQHAYHVTNINPQGVVPANELPNWTQPGLNNYRQNVQGEGVFNAPDLEVLGLEVDIVGCPNVLKLTARIANVGNLGVLPGVPVAFRSGTPDAPGDLLGVASTEVSLVPGQSTLVSYTVTLDSDQLSSTSSFIAIVNNDGSVGGVVLECNPDNAPAAADKISCSGLI